MEDKNKIFVKIQDYKDIKDILNLMQEKIKEARDVLEKINFIRSSEETAITKWNSDIKHVEEIVSGMNNSLNRI